MSEIGESIEKKKKQRKRSRETEAGEKKRTGIDEPFLVLVLLLLLIGLICLYSASYMEGYYDKHMSPYTFVIKQAFFAVIGIIAMFVMAKFDYRKLHYAAIPLMVGSTLLLATIYLPGGLWVTINDATRWIDLKIVTIQPSEITKFAFIVFFSSYVTIMGRKKIRGFRYGLLPFGAITLITAFLLHKQPHLSATVIIAGIGAVIMFIGGLSLGWVGLGGIAIVPMASWYLATHKYAMQRIKVWFNPFIDFRGSGWQGAQSLMAIASGGFWGLGFGQSRQKHGFLPEAPNDFIFAVILEELGFIGGMIIIGLFAALIYRGYKIAFEADDKFGTLLAAGVTTQIAIQTIFNMGVVSGLLPVTGAALPFFSYGGTSLVMLLGEVGVVLSVSKHRGGEE